MNLPSKERIPEYTIPLPKKFVSFLRGKATRNILDVGCGCGRACFFLNENHYRVSGVDVDEVQVQSALKEAKLRHIYGKIDFIVNDAQNLCFPTYSFDAVIMLGLLTLVSKPERARIMNEIHRVLKSSGYVFIEEFGQTWENPVYSRRYKEDLKVTGELSTIVVKDETGKHLHLSHHFTRKELLTLLGRFRVISFEEDIFTSYIHRNWVKGYVMIAQKTTKAQ